MLILFVTKSNGMTIDRIATYDFITLYGSSFSISERNLHGFNDFSFSEFTTKRTICSNAIKRFVLDGLVSANRGKDGFVYALTSTGVECIRKLESDYKTQYMSIVHDVHKKYARQSDTSLLKIITEAAIQALRS